MNGEQLSGNVLALLITIIAVMIAPFVAIEAMTYTKFTSMDQQIEEIRERVRGLELLTHAHHPRFPPHWRSP